MADIDIGAAAIDRPSAIGGYTMISKDNPANAAGKITKVFIYCDSDLTDCEVGIFQEVSANTFTTRSTVYIGFVLDDATREFDVDMDVEVGDYIGIYSPAGNVDRTEGVGAGFWYKLGDYIPCTGVGFSLWASQEISLYGEGEVPAPPAKKTLVQAALISIPPLIVLPTLGQIIKVAGG